MRIPWLHKLFHRRQAQSTPTFTAALGRLHTLRGSRLWETYAPPNYSWERTARLSSLRGSLCRTAYFRKLDKLPEHEPATVTL